jgi:hypothetical protein
MGSLTANLIHTIGLSSRASERSQPVASGSYAAANMTRRSSMISSSPPIDGSCPSGELGGGTHSIAVGKALRFAMPSRMPWLAARKADGRLFHMGDLVCSSSPSAVARATASALV